MQRNFWQQSKKNKNNLRNFFEQLLYIHFLSRTVNSMKSGLMKRIYKLELSIIIAAAGVGLNAAAAAGSKISPLILTFN